MVFVRAVGGRQRCLAVFKPFVMRSRYHARWRVLHVSQPHWRLFDGACAPGPQGAHRRERAMDVPHPSCWHGSSRQRFSDDASRGIHAAHLPVVQPPTVAALAPRAAAHSAAAAAARSERATAAAAVSTQSPTVARGEPQAAPASQETPAAARAAAHKRPRPAEAAGAASAAAHGAVDLGHHRRRRAGRSV